MRGQRAELAGKPGTPVVEETQRTDPVAGHGAGLELRTRGVLAQVVHPQELVRQRFHAPRVAASARIVDALRQRAVQERQQVRALDVLPLLELRRIVDVELLEKGAQRHRVLIGGIIALERCEFGSHGAWGGAESRHE